MINNRIVNGGFETGSLAPFTGSNVSIYKSARHSGTNSVKFTGGAVTSRLSQVVPVAPGENFEFLVSIAKVGSATGPPVSIVISYLNSGGAVISPTALSINFPSGNLPVYWREIYSTTTPAPDGATQARIEIIKNPLSSSAEVVVDDVALIAVCTSSTSGDLTVDGNTTIQRNLTVNGNTQLGNETFTDTVKVVGNFETLSNTGFYGPNNVFTGSVFVSNNIVVGSEIIDSGNIQALTVDLYGYPDSTTETVRVHYGNIAIMGAGFGIILRAPNNTRWLLTVDNDGNLITAPVS